MRSSRRGRSSRAPKREVSLIVGTAHLATREWTPHSPTRLSILLACPEYPCNIRRYFLRNLMSNIGTEEFPLGHKSSRSALMRVSRSSSGLGSIICSGSGLGLVRFDSIQKILKDARSSTFGCSVELGTHFRGILFWCKGASIGWHSDDNRSYLKQRDFAAVCYLNSHGKDFKGGAFHFKDGEPSSVFPVAGDVLIYTADDRNVHSVDEVLDGERLTLTLWFTRNRAHDEDAKLISHLSKSLSTHDKIFPLFLPLPASSNMYWFSDGVSGFDIRCARIQNFGFRFCLSKDQKISNFTVPDDSLELLNMPVRLSRGGETYSKEFINSLHGLQAIQFYYLKASEMLALGRKQGSAAESEGIHLLKKMNGSELVLPCDHLLAEKVLGSFMYCEHETMPFSWDEFSMAVIRWEEYMCSLYEQLVMLVPHWVTHQTIFLVHTSDF
ncbi:hypothetical protein KSP40_PGU010055 [Platanthera guangdongensis]|uniref:procollagen-proline 3-dioxygenase n=1 Tax=Platanthera guangdongensis TaxID=2320717 RepID=A0ABR2MTQ5_9ASPA